MAKKTALSPELSTAIDIAKPTLEKWLDKLLDKLDTKIKTTFIKDREHFMNYLDRTYEKLLKIRPVGFREHLDFLKVYIPLSIEDCNRNSKYVIDKFPKKLLRKHTLIVDNAGMGKSTIAKRMFISVYEDGSFGIPILIELRHLSSENGIIQEILSQIGNLSSDFDEKILTTLVENGGFVFFLDGYDEISIKEKSYVTKAIQSFIEKAGINNTFIITSRNDEALSGFQSFDQYSIKELEREEAYQLLRNLDSSGENSELLIQKLQNELSGVKEFLINPLLVTLLFTAFHYEPTIPTKKYLFYDQVFNAFFQQHDLSKGEGWVHEKHSKLAKDDFERILRCLGFISIINHKIEFTRTDIIEAIEKAKENNRNLDFKASDFLEDLIGTVPLFTIEGNFYRWTHKSLAEYFAVEFIVRDSKQEKEIINKLYKDDGVENVNLFDLYFDISPSGFREFLLLPCLRDVKYEVLPEDEDINKRIFCSRIIGLICHITKHNNISSYSSLINRHLLPSGYYAYRQSKPSEKWWTILNILLTKKYLFKTVNESNKELKEIPLIEQYLNEKFELHIDSSNIDGFTEDIVSELRYLFFPTRRRGVFHLLNREDCEKEINEIEQEINSKKNFSGFIM